MNLSPLPIQKFFDSNGLPLVGGKLFTYTAGTTTKVATYQESGGASMNTNPIVLDFRGECRLWIDPLLSYKFVLAPAWDADPPGSPIWSVDNIALNSGNVDNAAQDTGSGNTIQLAMPRLSGTPVLFDRIVWKSNITNTGPVNIVVNGGLSKPLVWQPSAALQAGAIQVSGMYEALYDGIQWQLQGPTLGPSQLRTSAEVAAGVTPVNYDYLPGDVRRYGYIADGVDGTGTGTDNATAIANCIASNVISDFPEGVGIFSGSIGLPVGKMIRGKGPRKTILRQTASATVSAIILGDVSSADITDGAHQIHDICIKAADNASAHGIEIGDGVIALNASMLDFSNVRLWSQHVETLGSPPYTTKTNQRGIYIRSAGSSIFFANLKNFEIRSFDIAIDAGGTPVGANEWYINGWFLDCRVGVRLSNCSVWSMDQLTIETAVSNARAFQSFNSVSNVKWMGGRWEITQAGGFGIEGDGTTTGANWRFGHINVLINGDGSGIPGRKWTGTLPNDFLFFGTDTVGPFQVIPNANQTMRMPQQQSMGGNGLGNAKLTMGRNAGGADCIVQHDGTHLVITGGNSVKIRGDGTANDRIEVNGTRVIITGADTATGYQAAMRFGTNSYVWVDSSGRLRIKQGAPSSDTDGTVVGTQT